MHADHLYSSSTGFVIGILGASYCFDELDVTLALIQDAKCKAIELQRVETCHYKEWDAQTRHKLSIDAVMVAAKRSGPSVLWSCHESPPEADRPYYSTARTWWHLDSICHSLVATFRLLVHSAVRSRHDITARWDGELSKEYCPDT